MSKSTKVVAARGNSLNVAFQQIREMIVRGQLSPGSWIIEADLAARLGVSRTLVRGALHWLQREGYVIASGNTSKVRMMVAPLTQDDARELYAIVGHIEGLAARLTAQLPSEQRDVIIQKLTDINVELAETAHARRTEPNRIFDLDTTFHRTVVEASAGGRLLDLYKSIKPQTERYWRLYASAILDELATSVAEHDVILAALREGDADGAEKGIQANWVNGAERLAKVIDSLGERGSW